MPLPRRSVVRDQWDVFQVLYDGRRGIVSFDAEAARQPEHVSYAHQRRILATFGASTENDGMPTERGSARLMAFEDMLVGALDAAGVDGWLVGRLTTEGSRIFVFQLNQPELFDGIAATVVRSFADLNPRVAKATGWQFFDENIRPTFTDEVQMVCARVIDGLKEGGIDLSRPHMLDHSFVGSVAQLSTVRQQLETHGYAVHQPEATVLVASRTSSLNIFEVTELACDLHEVAEKAGVRYSGWGANILAGGRRS
jgi:hypothetical protein